MANSFKSVTFADVNSTQQFYTVPTGATVTIIGMTVAYATGNNGSPVTAEVYVNKNVGDTVHIVRAANIPEGSSLVVAGGDQKVVLESQDQLYIKTISASQYVDVFISYMETT